MELVLKRKFELLRPPFSFFLLSLFLASLFLCPDAESARKPVVVKMGGGEAVVTALQGTAKLALPDGGWRLLKTGNTMKGGDQVVTGADSRLEITLPDRSCLRFAENTSFKVVQIDVNEEANRRTVRVNVALGKTWANVSKTFRVKPKVEVSCENAVAGVRGTIYRMNVNEDRSVLIRVYEGEVAVWGGGKATERPTTKAGPPEGVSGPVSVPGPQKVTMEEWVELVKAMQQITVSPTGVAGKPCSFTEEEDREDWVDWNRRRDAEAFGSGETSTAETESSFFDWFK